MTTRTEHEPGEGADRLAWLQRGVVADGVWSRLTRLDLIILVLVTGFYLATRLVSLADYPIYFFCDEAIHGTIAEDLLEAGLRDPEGVLLPAFFRNVEKYNLGLSIYVHAVGVWLFGSSVFVLRAVSVLVGTLAVVATGLALRLVLEARLWWVAPLALAGFPAWFLHSRTAFETAMMVGFFAAFLLCYLLYRTASPWWSLPALVFGAATFYSYSNGQGVTAFCALALLASDCRYHLELVRRRPKVMAVAVVVALLLASPYLRFRFVLHPEMVDEHFRNLNSYLVMDLPLQEKVERYVHNYLGGIDPGYWFFEDVDELVRHRMKGYGHLPVWTMPLIVIGVGVCLWRWRSPPYRVILIAVLAAPFSASMVGLRITRLLAMMVPAAMLAGVGAELLHGVLSRWRRGRHIVPAVMVVVLTGGATFLTWDALSNGARWFENYGLYGMQYGARQVFAAVHEELDRDPNLRLKISHSWANNPNAFIDFFLPEEDTHRVGLFVVADLLQEKRPIVREAVSVLPVQELNEGLATGKLEASAPLRTIDYPDGSPGFVFVRLAYSDQADAIFAAEAEARRQLVNAQIEIEGLGPTLVRHSVLDMGPIDLAFDADGETLARTADAEPCVLELHLPTPREVSGVRLLLWGTYYRVRLLVTPPGDDGDATPLVAEEMFAQLPPKPTVEIQLSEVVEASTVRVEITKSGDRHVHVRELVLLPEEP